MSIAAVRRHHQPGDVEVRRYILPRFKVALALDRPYYLPGQTIRGRAQGDYASGKPSPRAP